MKNNHIPDVRILGAGLAGCIAGFVFPSAQIYERNQKDYIDHKALLRFKTDSISKLIGIPFRRVEIFKAIQHQGTIYSKATPQTIIAYSKKVSGSVSARSIKTVGQENSIRYITPNNFLMLLREILSDRITYSYNIGIWTLETSKEPKHKIPIISTLPMNILSDWLNMKSNVFKQHHKKIHVLNAHIPNSDIFSTIYFTGQETPIYRANISGDTFIAESLHSIKKADVEYCLDAFSLTTNDLHDAKHSIQIFGKIHPINDQWRRNFIFQNTVQHKIYSLGRFATWRNILLDDVLNDALKIRQFINKDLYEYYKNENNFN